MWPDFIEALKLLITRVKKVSKTCTYSLGFQEPVGEDSRKYVLAAKSSVKQKSQFIRPRLSLLKLSHNGNMLFIHVPDQTMISDPSAHRE